MLPRMKRKNSIIDLEMRPDVQEKVASCGTKRLPKIYRNIRFGRV
jgi:hypothetical protein